MYKKFFLICSIHFSLTLFAHSAPLTPENDPWNINRNSFETDPSKYIGEWKNHQYFPSPDDWRALSVYHLVTDRFRDGNPLNNTGKYGGFNPKVYTMRQGGDFKGITDSLDYIKGLGFDVIWISPIFQNLENEYHGYGQIDFTLLDDRFGTLEDFREMISEAHKRNMYVIVDIVVNHLSSLLAPEGFQNKAAPFRLYDGEYRLFPKDKGIEYSDFKVVNEFNKYGEYCDAHDLNGNKFKSLRTGTFSESDFNHNGDLQVYRDPWQNMLGAIYGKYNDLRLCSNRVQQKIIAMTKSLISSTDIDGIRIDTPMQVPLSFFKFWIPEVKSFAKSLGKDRFFMFGELYCPRGKAAVLLGRGKAPQMYGKDEYIDSTHGMDGGIHYGFYTNSIISTLVNSPPSLKRMGELLENDLRSYDFFQPDVTSFRYQMLNFFDSHDQRRLITFEDGKTKIKLATVLISFWPGIPIFYQGDEQELSTFGKGLDSNARESMMSSVAWDSLPSLSLENPASKDNFDMGSPGFKYTQKVFNLRKDLLGHSQSLGYERLVDFEEQNKNLFIFSREASIPNEKIIIALNFSPNDVTLSSLLLKNYPKRYLTPSENILSPWSAEIFSSDNLFNKAYKNLATITPNKNHDSILSTQESITFTALQCELQNNLNKKFSVFNNGELVPYQIAQNKNMIKISPVESWKPGIIKVTVAPEVCAPMLKSNYFVRFRINSGDSIFTDKKIVSDSTLISEPQIQSNFPSVTLHHKAPGASWFRAKNNSSNWGSWHPYREKTTWKLDPYDGLHEITVQYWIDGSSAYFVNDFIDLAIPSISSEDFDLKKQ